MKIVVLAGGLSTEREVSLSSGSKVTQALRQAGHDAVIIDAFLGIDSLPDNTDEFFRKGNLSGIVTVGESEPDLDSIKKSRTDSGYGTLGKNVLNLCREADIVYMGLHGENGENGKMQAMFDVLEIKYTGSGYLASALAMHKGLTKTVLVQGGICMPKGLSVTRETRSSLGGLRLPCVVKPCCGGSSVGVSLVNTEEELDRAISEALEYEDEILIEEFIAGREFSVGILGDMVLPPIEIRPEGGFYDYRHKYLAGLSEEICPADITDAECAVMQEAAKKAAELLGIEVYARIDFILAADGTPYCLEANTLPGMTPTSLLPQEAAAADTDYISLCEKIIQLSLRKYPEYR